MSESLKTFGIQDGTNQVVIVGRGEGKSKEIGEPSSDQLRELLDKGLFKANEKCDFHPDYSAIKLIYSVPDTVTGEMDITRHVASRIGTKNL